jgi:RNA 3'-terminal phosphate cyclase
VAAVAPVAAFAAAEQAAEVADSVRQEQEEQQRRCNRQRENRAAGNGCSLDAEASNHLPMGRPKLSSFAKEVEDEELRGLGLRTAGTLGRKRAAVLVPGMAASADPSADVGEEVVRLQNVKDEEEEATVRRACSSKARVLLVGCC